jgi:hypothetical protein
MYSFMDVSVMSDQLARDLAPKPAARAPHDANLEAPKPANARAVRARPPRMAHILESVRHTVQGWFEPSAGSANSSRA